MHRVGEMHRIWGRNIKALREARGLSRYDLAEMVGVTMPTVWKWEHGQMGVRDSHKLLVSKALGTEMFVLFPMVAA